MYIGVIQEFYRDIMGLTFLRGRTPQQHGPLLARWQIAIPLSGVYPLAGWCFCFNCCGKVKMSIEGL